MEEESKMSFWKKFKTSILGLEEYEKLATQKITKTIGYVTILMLIFAFFLCLGITYRFHETVNSVIQYIDTHIETLNFKEGKLLIKGKDNPDGVIIIEEENNFNGKIIIDTNKLELDQIKEYEDEIETYANGILILQDKVIVKMANLNAKMTISLAEIAEQINLVNVEKQHLLNLASSSQIYSLDVAFYIVLFIGIFINFLATLLLDIILYSFIGYVVGICSRVRLRYSAVYNIAAYSLTLPVLLNLVYALVNILTGYEVEYFAVMYMAIACIYIITAILMIKADMIKKQIELSKIISEQEKVKQEIERKQQEEKEEAEKEKVRKEDEKKRQEEKRKKEEKKEEGPEPQANIQAEK
ncbi:MAG: DUF1189 domain-containing protein [Clostridia bacterium]|nr:DUF1189 domain-containing protein [Clostridia bacterium]